jgi:hypothetical protein
MVAVPTDNQSIHATYKDSTSPTELTEPPVVRGRLVSACERECRRIALLDRRRMGEPLAMGNAPDGGIEAGTRRGREDIPISLSNSLCSAISSQVFEVC